MANYYTPYDPIFYAQEGLMVLENALGMAARVHRGYDAERKSANVGSTIQIRKPGTFSTQAGGTGTAADVAPTYINLSVNNWREVKFALTDQELAYTSAKIIEEHVSPAVYSLANYIETQITGLYTKVPWSYNMSATPTEADIVGARKILRDNAGSLMDQDYVHFAIDSTLEAAFLNRAVFHAANISGPENTMSLMRGHLGTRFGVEHFVQQTLTNFTSGTVVSASSDAVGTLSATAAIRATTISVTSLTGTQTLVAGDSFVIAGNTQRYVVAANASLTSGANAAVTCYPGMVQQYSSGAVITFEEANASNFADRYFANIMFHKNAFAFATAPLPMIGDGAGARMAVITDPRTGLSLRSRVAYTDSSATVNVTLDVLFGVKCLDPNLAVICRRNYA
jgi:hypothetical protein